jgi:tetratricopeptide (TPR) repeat protein
MRARWLLWVLLLVSAAPRPALAWDWFRSENSDVKRGNELLERNKPSEALQAFDAAQRSLPNDPGVQLNRGLGLLAKGEIGPAREALAASAQRATTPDLRSKAQYNLGLTFLREADAHAAPAGATPPATVGGAPADAAPDDAQLQQSQQLLREAVDAFKSSLRSSPGNRDAAWNLELARRRLVDLENKQKQREQEKKDQQEKQDQEQQDQHQNPDQDGQKDDQQKPGEPKQEPQPPEPNKDDSSKSDKPDEQPQQKPEQPKSDDAKPAPQPDKGGKPPEAQQPAPNQQQAPQNALPQHMQQALDALSENDDNLQKQRARARARQRPQRVEKDW